MSKKDRSESQTYLIKVKDGYIAAIEGKKDYHVPANDSDICEIERLIRKRQVAGEKLTALITRKFGLTTMSASHATHTTGAGDYEGDDPKPQKKRKKK